MIFVGIAHGCIYPRSHTRIWPGPHDIVPRRTLYAPHAAYLIIYDHTDSTWTHTDGRYRKPIHTLGTSGIQQPRSSGPTVAAHKTNTAAANHAKLPQPPLSVSSGKTGAASANATLRTTGTAITTTQSRTGVIPPDLKMEDVVVGPAGAAGALLGLDMVLKVSQRAESFPVQLASPLLDTPQATAVSRCLACSRRSLVCLEVMVVRRP